MWNDKQRKWFLLSLLGRCRPPQLFYIRHVLDENKIYKAQDFTQVLPKYVSMYIFSFLSPRDLSRCAQTNSHWKYLTEQVSQYNNVRPNCLALHSITTWNIVKDELWIPKCIRYGWFLPYKPRESETGAWKFFYILCSMAVSDLPISKVRSPMIHDF